MRRTGEKREQTQTQLIVEYLVVPKLYSFVADTAANKM